MPKILFYIRKLSLTRQHVRNKVAVQVFYDKKHIKLIEYRLDSVGSELVDIPSHRFGKYFKINLIFPCNEER